LSFSCKSALIKARTTVGPASEIKFICTCCADEVGYAQAAEAIATLHHYADLYYAMTKGGEAPVEYCSQCGHFCYLTDEAECVLCLDDSPGRVCGQCGASLEQEVDPEDGLTRLCGICRYAIEAD
jgi:hypothetical protein